MKDCLMGSNKGGGQGEQHTTTWSVYRPDARAIRAIFWRRPLVNLLSFSLTASVRIYIEIDDDHVIILFSNNMVCVLYSQYRSQRYDETDASDGTGLGADGENLVERRFNSASQTTRRSPIY